MPAILPLIAALAALKPIAVSAIVIDLGPTSPPKAPCNLDLLFLDDGSSSICKSDPDPTCPNWKSNINFIKNIIRSLNIGTDKTRVAYLKYGSKTDLRWNLNRYTTEASLLSALDAEANPGGELSSTDSFSVVVTDVFTAAAGDRPEVANVAIIITDNANLTEQAVATASAQLQEAANLKMMAVCVNTTTSKCAESCGRSLASKPQLKNVTYFMSSHYLFIGDVLSNVLAHICDPKAVEPTCDACSLAIQKSLAEVNSDIKDLRARLEEQFYWPQSPDAICSSGFTYLPSTKSCYKVVYENYDWYSASSRCQGLRPGAHLAAITSATEQSELKTFLGSDISKKEGVQSACMPTDQGSVTGVLLWTSGKQQTKGVCPSTFLWKTSSGEQPVFSYTSWEAGEPNCGTEELCVHIWVSRNYNWNDQSCTMKTCPLCEYTP